MDLDLNTEQQVILDAMVDGIRGVDAAGIITLCNDALLRMTGYTRAEVLGHNAHELLHHSRADGSRIPNEQCDLLRASVRGEATVGLGGVLWKKDGTCMAVEYCGRALKSAASRPATWQR